MSDDGHFEFYDLWENGVIYSLAYVEMDSAQNFYIEITNELLFLKNAYRSLSRAIFQFFVLTKMIELLFITGTLKKSVCLVCIILIIITLLILTALPPSHSPLSLSLSLSASTYHMLV